MEADKNRLILEKNALVAKREELRGEVAAFQQSAVFQRPMSLPFTGFFNQGIREVASILGRNKLKVRILDAFDRTKGIFKGFLTQMKIYH